MKRFFQILIEDGSVELIKKSFQKLSYLFFAHFLSKEFAFRVYTFKNHLLNCIRYDAPSDPYKRIYVNPNTINYRVYYKIHKGFQYVHHDSFNLESEKRSGIGQIKGGKWDCKKFQKDVSEIPKIRGIHERFENGTCWKNTTYFKYFLHKKDKQKQNLSQSDKQHVLSQCEKVDDIYKDIRDNGYKCNHAGPRLSGKLGIREQLEVLVVIGRNGDIFLWDGQHRFAIAQVLDLKIPVQVVCRHKRWQKLRDYLHNNEFPGDYSDDLQNHPDLQDLAANQKM